MYLIITGTIQDYEIENITNIVALTCEGVIRAVEDMLDNGYWCYLCCPQEVLSIDFNENSNSITITYRDEFNEVNTTVWSVIEPVVY